MTKIKKIAILGATSQIAKDLILSFVNENNIELSLFARSPERVQDWLSNIKFSGACSIAGLSEFGTQEFDAVINFIGVGNPAQAQAMGKEIFDVTLQYDQVVLDYLQKYPDCKYIFMSSGAAYGSDFIEPATHDKPATFYLNSLSPHEWYGIAKFYTECRHRARPELNIVDIRVFNYFSSTQDINARFLITDILRAVRDKNVFKTTPDNIIRDYLHPTDFYQLVCLILSASHANTALDCYSKAPIDKLNLLNLMRDSFGLQYVLVEENVTVNATGGKPNYYSLNRRAADFGYKPKFSSLDGLIKECSQLLTINTNA